jgi:hypothetical protein
MSLLRCYIQVQVFCFTFVAIAILVAVSIHRHRYRHRRHQSDVGIGMSALELVRQLQSPSVESTTVGEMEGLAFWNQHDATIKQAWEEWAFQQEQLSSLPPLDETVVMDPTLYQYIHQAWNDPNSVEKE